MPRSRILRKFALAAGLAAATTCADRPLPVPLVHPPAPVCPAPSGITVAGFHGAGARLGWNDAETLLAPRAVAGASFELLWESAPFDSIAIGGRRYAPYLYASPLYADDVVLNTGAFAGSRVSMVIAASSNGYVYAINAVGTDCGNTFVPAGAPLWRTSVGTPALVGPDGGVPLGVLSTPVLDVTATPPRVYVAAAFGPKRWQVYALDLRNGEVLSGWPIAIDAAAVAAIAPGAPPFQQEASGSYQRSALALTADGATLYVSFGGLGWMMALDTRAPRLSAAFAGAPVSAMENAGMWAPGGAAIDSHGTLYATTGNAIESGEAQPGYWGESLLAWTPTLHLAGTYTPFNYCGLEHNDIDVCGSSPIVIPDLDPATTATPHLVAFGSKQGNVYLLDRDHLPGTLEGRQACSQTAASDASLLPPDAQPQFGTRGPLNVFGPYSETFGNLDYAKMRTTPAYFHDDAGRHYLYVSGATKAAEDSMQSVPPSLVRLRIVLSPGKPAYLAVDAIDHELAFVNPGSPVVTSNGGRDPVVWVLDENAKRTKSLLDADMPHPILYAVDGATMKLLFRSDRIAPLPVGGKYSTVAVAHGVVFVGTDRISAFGVGAP